jgi:hypothetical protein
MEHPMMFSSFMDEEPDELLTYGFTNQNEERVQMKQPTTLYGRNFKDFSHYIGKNVMELRGKSQDAHRFSLINKRTNLERKSTSNINNKISRKTIRKQVCIQII